MKREGEGRCHQVPALLKHHGEQKNAPSSKQWQKHKEHWDWTCAVTTLQVEAMDIMKAVESGMGSHSQLLYKKKISQRYYIWKNALGSGRSGRF